MFVQDKFNELLAAVSLLNGGKSGNILNWKEEFDTKILETMPEMTGRAETPALHESHIFLLPIWNETDNPIDWNLVGRYNEVVRLFNLYMENTYPYWKQMKNPLLALNFVNTGFLSVMQSSLYLMSNDRSEIIHCTHLLAKLFSTAGFDVVREKIEASVHGINGIPTSSEDAQKFTGYFEFHIRVEANGDDSNPLGPDEIELLNKLGKEYEEKFQTPVPTSFNRVAHVEGGYQRYLNVRFRGIGSDEAVRRVGEITTKINESGVLRVFKVISEYVWYDTFVEMDRGWIDF